MLKNKHILIITILLVALILSVFQKVVFAQDTPNTKVIITGIWTNLENRETTVVLTNSTTGKVYNGILKDGQTLIFKNIDYGTYTITCNNPLDIEYVKSSLTGDTFTLTQNGTTQIEENITVTNKAKNVSGFYSTSEANNPMKYTIPVDPLSITLTEVIAEVVADGTIVSEIKYDAPIPVGFYYVGGTRDTGIVISDNVADANKGDSHTDADTLVGNQFVWIPASTGTSKVKVGITSSLSDLSDVVEKRWESGNNTLTHFQTGGGTTLTGDTFDAVSGETYTVYAKNSNGKEVIKTITISKSMYDSTNNIGQLYDFSSGGTAITYSSTGYREPSYLTSSYNGDASTTNTVGITDVLLTSEFDSVIASVKKYGGFYVGRYETGNLSSTTAVVSKKGNTDISGQNWYTMYKKQKELYSSSTSVTSSMMWGSQWDATMNWMQSSSDSNIANFVTNSTGKGNYLSADGGTGAKKATGSSENYKINNMYDIGGNVWEWTLEAYDASYRISRRR